MCIRDSHLGGGTPTFMSPENLKFLIEETLLIHQIKQSTGLTFEQTCLLVSKAYEYFRLLPTNTNPINYSHSLKTNIYQIVNRRKEDIYNFLDLESGINNKIYQQRIKEVDEFLTWVKSIIK